jgi:AcrR family transcriptional regulator
LRELKYGRSRLSLLKAFISSLDKTPLEDIRIRDLCAVAEVSEPSFYNYFPRKDDLFLYFISLWSIDVQLHIHFKRPEVIPGVDSIREIFSYTAKGISQSPRLMKEIIAYQARTNTSQRIEEIRAVTNAEKALAFGVTDELYNLHDQGLHPLLTQHITEARHRGQIPSQYDIQELTLLTAAVFFGIPIITLHQNADKLNDYYQKCLDMLFNLTSSGGKYHER